MSRRESWLPSSRIQGGSHSSRSRRKSNYAARRIGVLTLLVFVLAVFGSVVQLLRAVPYPTVSSSVNSAYQVPGPTPTLPWPSQGEAEVYLPDVGVLGSYGGTTPVPIASVAKIMTALIIVKDHALGVGQSGPSLTMTSQDYAIYRSQFNSQDSVMEIAPGESLTEYQMLEALLIPSADNIASTLAAWDAGSVGAFVSKMNAMAHSLGLRSTHYSDPSGLDAQTVSVPSDQIKLAQLLEANPVLAQIVAMPQATLPIVGVVYNVDYDLGTAGIVGVKTGSTPLGGNFVFAAQISVGGVTKLLYGAVLGQGTQQPLIAALNEAKALVRAARTLPHTFEILHSNQVVGTLSTPQGTSTQLVSSSDLAATGWGGVAVKVELISDLKTHIVASGSRVGQVLVTVGNHAYKVPVTVKDAIQSPSLGWRLTHL